MAKEKETSEKIAARAFAKTYVASLVPSVFTSLSKAGYFYDEQERGAKAWAKHSSLVLPVVQGFCLFCCLPFFSLSPSLTP